MARFIAILISLMVAVGAADAAPDEALLTRVRSEYPAALKVLEEEYAIASGQGNSKIVIPSPPPGGQRTIEGPVDVAVNGLNERVIRHLTDSNANRTGSQDSVDCVNAKYSFVLKRAEPHLPYLLGGIEMVRNSEILNEIGVIGRNYLFASFSIDEYRISQLLSDPKYRLTAASLDSLEGREVVQLQFESADPKAPIPAGTLWVNPSERWILLKAQYFYHPSRKRMFERSIQYESFAGGKLAPKHITILEPSKLRREFTFDRVQFVATPESQFYLPAFGLPELSNRPGADLSQNHAGSWLIGLGVVSLGIALTFRYFAGRGRFSGRVKHVQR